MNQPQITIQVPEADFRKVAATAVGDEQVSADEYRPWNKTRVFPMSATIAELDAFAKRQMGEHATWQSLRLSEVEHE